MDIHEKNLFRDIGLILLSIVVSFIMIKINLLGGLLTATHEIKYLSSFIAGLFFTSIFTTAPAIVALGEMAQSNSVIVVAIFGALGALIGDLMIFRFVKCDLMGDISYLLKKTHFKRIASIPRLHLFRWVVMFLGAAIIASPLPDELGIAMMGLCGTRTWIFSSLSLTFNFAGIMAVGLIAQKIIS